jgi:mono/diheme cytochrome c family protein
MNDGKILNWLTITANLSIMVFATGVEAQEAQKAVEDRSVPIVAARIESDDSGSLEGYGKVYQETCAVCHGERLEGAPQGTPLIGELKHGDTVEAIMANIANGFPDKGMPPWSATMSEMEIKSLAMYVAESRAGLDYADFNYDTELTVPEGPIEAENHAFRFDVLIDDLDAQPFSIAPLPDGSMLITEKKLACG